MSSLVFRPAGEQQVDAFRKLFEGYREFQQKRYPIPEHAREAWIHAVTKVTSPLSFACDEYVDHYKTRQLVFDRTEVRLDGWEEISPFTYNRQAVRERFYVWYNPEVWKAYQDHLKLQTILANDFSQELKKKEE